MAARLPIVGGDDGNWGQILNDFLTQEHNADGTLKNVLRPGDISGKYSKPVGGIPAADLNVADIKTNLRIAKTFEDFGAVGDGIVDDTVALQAAFSASQQFEVRGSPGKIYLFSDTITIPQYGARVVGLFEADAAGTVLKFNALDGRPAFTNNSDLGLSWCTIEHLQIISTNPPGTAGAGDCFKIYGVTNNSHFTNLEIRNFPGHAFNIMKKTNSSDHTAAGNVIFDQIFILSCGGYAYIIDGYINALWNMPDINSCMGGAFYFKNGVSNQATGLINGLWWEGNRAWTSTNPVKLENMGGQAITFIAPNFQSPIAGTDVITITGNSTAQLSLLGAAGYGYSGNWINDSSTGASVASVPFSSRITYLGTGISSPASVLRSIAPTLELWNDSGNINQRRWRWAFSSGSLALQLRNDDGSLASTLFNMTPSGSLTVGGVVGTTVQAQGNGALIELYDTSGVTANQRRWRFVVSGNQLALLQRNDDGTSVRVDFYINGSSGLFEVINTFKADKAIVKSRVTSVLSSNGSVSLDTSSGVFFEITLQANATSTAFSTPVSSGQEITVTFIQDAVGGHTYAWPVLAKFAGGSAPSDTTANRRTSVTFIYDGSNWYETARAVAVG
jgi:hypothetical protein